MQEKVEEIQTASKSETIKHSTQKKLLMIFIGYTLLTILAYVTLYNGEVQGYFPVVIRAFIRIIGDSILCAYVFKLYKQTEQDYRLVLKWLVGIVCSFSIAHIFALIGAMSTDMLFIQEITINLEHTFDIFTNIGIFGFVFAMIRHERKNIIMYQIIFDSLTILFLLGAIIWDFVLYDWIVNLVAVKSSVWILFLITLMSLSGLIIMMKMVYLDKVQKQQVKQKMLTILALGSFCVFNFIAAYQHVLWETTTIVLDFTLVWQCALLLVIFSQYHRTKDQEPVMPTQTLTLEMKIQQVSYIYLVAAMTIILLEFNFTAIVFTALVLMLHFVATKYVYVYQENCELLVKYEQMNTELEATVTKRTKQLIDKNTELEMLSKYDPITDLPNKLYLETHLKELIESEAEFTLIFLNLDHFKTVNDWYGHQVGDELLIAITKRIREVLPKGTFFARRSGDEFAIIFDARVESETQLDELMESFKKPVELKNHQMTYTFSIGVAKFPHQAHTKEEMIKYADIALHHAKTDGKNCWRLYEENDQRQLKLEHDLKNSKFDGDFELYYQPQMDANSEALIGCEALIRWHHPVLGFINPLEFISLAEENGTIHRLGLWVIETA
ncbi:MAG: diguanylate cyclase domain-containing protein, partial [Culicoidibacterales bacterium]